MQHLKSQWIVRSLIALALLCVLGMATTVAAPKASAHAALTTATCGNYVSLSGKYANLVIKGVTVGYVEGLVADCGNQTYKVRYHAHVSVNPSGNKYSIILAATNDNYTGTPGWSAAVPQDVYLDETISTAGTINTIDQFMHAGIQVNYLHNINALYGAGF